LLIVFPVALGLHEARVPVLNLLRGPCTRVVLGLDTRIGLLGKAGGCAPEDHDQEDRSYTGAHPP